jgi:hypothetical protein
MNTFQRTFTVNVTAGNDPPAVLLKNAAKSRPP